MKTVTTRLVTVGIRLMPTIIRITPTIRPEASVGTTSPKPVVVTVATAHQSASPIDPIPGSTVHHHRADEGDRSREPMITSSTPRSLRSASRLPGEPSLHARPFAARETLPCRSGGGSGDDRVDVGQLRPEQPGGDDRVPATRNALRSALGTPSASPRTPNPSATSPDGRRAVGLRHRARETPTRPGATRPSRARRRRA